MAYVIEWISLDYWPNHSRRHHMTYVESMWSEKSATLCMIQPASPSRTMRWSMLKHRVTTAAMTMTVGSGGAGFFNCWYQRSLALVCNWACIRYHWGYLDGELSLPSCQSIISQSVPLLHTSQWLQDHQNHQMPSNDKKWGLQLVDSGKTDCHLELIFAWKTSSVVSWPLMMITKMTIPCFITACIIPVVRS